MHNHDLAQWQHDHTFGQDAVQPGERRTLAVVIITATAMVVEIAAGLAFGSMALLADGIHMASHAMALAIALFAYIFARRYAGHGRFSFGTGKVNAMGGFVGAILLVVFAAGMAYESVQRMAAPVDIQFDRAIAVAVLGLVVNIVCAVILGGGHSHGGGDYHHHHHSHGDDHNLRAAYLHVVVDALTSVLAIIALVAGKFAGATWLDPAMGIVGAVLITRWSWGLLKDSGKTLMDFEAPDAMRAALRDALERNGDRVADLHVWSIGPGIYAAAVSLVSDAPQTARTYHERVPPRLSVRHLTVEVHHCQPT